MPLTHFHLKGVLGKKGVRARARPHGFNFETRGARARARADPLSVYKVATGNPLYKRKGCPLYSELYMGDIVSSSQITSLSVQSINRQSKHVVIQVFAAALVDSFQLHLRYNLVNLVGSKVPGVEDPSSIHLKDCRAHPAQEPQLQGCRRMSKMKRNHQT